MSYFLTKSSRTELHCCGRSTSPARSHASISVQQMSAKVSRLAGSPLVAAAIASSSRARP